MVDKGPATWQAHELRGRCPESMRIAKHYAPLCIHTVSLLSLNSGKIKIWDYGKRPLTAIQVYDLTNASPYMPRGAIMSIAEKAPKPYHTGRFAGARSHIISDEQMREQYRPLPTSFVHVTHLEDGPELNAIRAMTAISHTALVERSGPRTATEQREIDYSRPCQWPHCECMTETGVNCKAGLTRGVTLAEIDYSEIERRVMAAAPSDRALAFQALFGDALAPVMEELRHVIFDDEETRAFDQREQARQGDGVRDGRSRHEMLKETHVVVGDHPPERRQCWPDTGEGD